VQFLHSMNDAGHDIQDAECSEVGNMEEK